MIKGNMIKGSKDPRKAKEKESMRDKRQKRSQKRYKEITKAIEILRQKRYKQITYLIYRLLLLGVFRLHPYPTEHGRSHRPTGSNCVNFHGANGAHCH